MTDHIYCSDNVISRNDRPNMFIKELDLYLDYLYNKIEEARDTMTKKQEKYLINFSRNLEDGINYYHNLFSNVKDKFEDTKSIIINDLMTSKESLQQMHLRIEDLSCQLVAVK